MPFVTPAFDFIRTKQQITVKLVIIELNFNLHLLAFDQVSEFQIPPEINNKELKL